MFGHFRRWSRVREAGPQGVFEEFGSVKAVPLALPRVLALVARRLLEKSRRQGIIVYSPISHQNSPSSLVEVLTVTFPFHSPLFSLFFTPSQLAELEHHGYTFEMHSLESGKYCQLLGVNMKYDRAALNTRGVHSIKEQLSTVTLAARSPVRQ